MCRTISLLTWLVVGLVVIGSSSGQEYPGRHMELKVDLCYRHPDYPGDANKGDPESFKGAEEGFEDWIAWSPWNDPEPHDSQNIFGIGGSLINLSLASGKGGSYNQFVRESRLDVPGRICNTYLINREPHSSPPATNIHLVIWGVLEGEYWVYGYHNNPSVKGSPIMPRINVMSFCADSNFYDSHGCPFDDDCLGVTKIPVGEPCDLNVLIQSETEDPLLETSLVKFTTDGSPVEIEYVGADANCATLNAFIILAPIPVTAWAPTPRPPGDDACPEVVLEWYEGEHATHHDVYLGTDFNDVNDATTAYDPNGVYMGRQGVEDVNYDPAGLLEFGQTYHWRVDEVNNVHPNSPWKGRIWSFTIESGKAKPASPADGQWSVLTAATLNWSPSCVANTHDVYLGTDYNSVSNATTSTPLDVYVGSPSETTYDPCGLEAYTPYYLRVDEVGDTTFVKGDVWTFVTMGGTLFYFPFDGVPDANIHDPCDERLVRDVMDNVAFEIRGDRDELTYGETNPLYNTTGTSAHFDDVGLYRGIMGYDASNTRGGDITDLSGPEYTIEMWIMPEDPPDNMALFGKWDRSYVLDVNLGSLRFSHGGSAPIASDANVIPIEEGNWYHIAAVFDSADACDPQKLYIDGEVVASGGNAALNPDDDDDPVTIGASINPGEHDPEGKGYERLLNTFEGFIDELRVSDIVLPVGQFLFRGDLALAWGPKPRPYGTEVARDVTLTWRPGDYAAYHRVYFGTSWDDVNDATTSSDEYKGPKNLGDESYSPDPLKLQATFYWRVDEVNDSNLDSPWKGRVWQFTTRNYLVVDDMEAYDDDAVVPQHPINYAYGGTWVDGWFNATGSSIYLEYGSGAAVHSGEKAMWLEYMDDGFWGPGVYHSEVYATTAGGAGTLGFQKNWQDDGVEALTLFFYGEPNNDPEPMYVGLEDTLGHLYVSNYGDYAGQDSNDMTEDEWHQWDIRLVDFDSNGVDTEDVNKILIGTGYRDDHVAGGTGNLYIDDIRLYRPRCVPWFAKPDYDFSDNCIVDLADVAIMGQEWLLADAYLPVAPPPYAPVGWWKLDGDANDSSGNGYDGTAEGSYSWVAGSIDNAIEFTDTGGKVLVPDDGNTPLLRPAAEISATAWVNAATEQSGNSRIVAKGLDTGDRENFALQVDEDDASYYVRDANTLYGADSERKIFVGEWTHIAGTYDGSTVKCYVNGQLKGSEVADAIALQQDSNSLAIGDAVDVPRAFKGKVDDVRVYDYGLSAEHVAYIASKSTGGAGTVYMPLLAEANIYDEEVAGQKAVNFKDYAKLMGAWLEVVAWP